MPGIPKHSRHYQSMNGSNCLESTKGFLFCVERCVCSSLFRVFGYSLSLDPFIFLGKDSFTKSNQIKSCHIVFPIWILITFMHFAHVLNICLSYLFLYLPRPEHCQDLSCVLQAYTSCLLHTHNLFMSIQRCLEYIYIFLSV